MYFVLVLLYSSLAQDKYPMFFIRLSASNTQNKRGQIPTSYISYCKIQNKLGGMFLRSWIITIYTTRFSLFSALASYGQSLHEWLNLSQWMRPLCISPNIWIKSCGKFWTTFCAIPPSRIHFLPPINLFFVRAGLVLSNFCRRACPSWGVSIIGPSQKSCHGFWHGWGTYVNYGLDQWKLIFSR